MRVGGKEANPAQAGDGGGAAEEFGEGGTAIAVFAVGIHVLAEEGDFDAAAGGEFGELEEDVMHGAADFGAAGVGDDAKGAEVAAAAHNFDESLPGMGAARDAFVEGFGRGSTGGAAQVMVTCGRFERWQGSAQALKVQQIMTGERCGGEAALQCCTEKRRDAAASICTADEIKMRKLLEQACT